MQRILLVVQSGHAPRASSASLPCTTVAVRRGAGAKKDSVRFCAIPPWITPGSFISHLVSVFERSMYAGHEAVIHIEMCTASK